MEYENSLRVTLSGVFSLRHSSHGTPVGPDVRGLELAGTPDQWEAGLSQPTRVRKHPNKRETPPEGISKAPGRRFWSGTVSHPGAA